MCQFNIQHGIYIDSFVLWGYKPGPDSQSMLYTLGQSSSRKRDHLVGLWELVFFSKLSVLSKLTSQHPAGEQHSCANVFQSNGAPINIHGAQAACYTIPFQLPHLQRGFYPTCLHVLVIHHTDGQFSLPLPNNHPSLPSKPPSTILTYVFMYA